MRWVNPAGEAMDPPAGSLALGSGTTTRAALALDRSRILGEVLPVAARGRALLSLVLRAERAGTVRRFSRLGQLREGELSVLHSVVDRDREIGHVRELERDVAVPAGVDEPCRGVDEQSEPAKRRFPLEPGDEVVRKPDAFEGGAEHELAGVEDERPLVVDLDQLGQVLLWLLDVDERIARVVEDAEEAVNADVHARGREQRRVVRIDLDAPFFEEPRDGSIGENHADDSMVRLSCRSTTLPPICRSRSTPMSSSTASSWSRPSSPGDDARAPALRRGGG